MPSEALKELREWQRAQATEQDKAFRLASRALARLAQLEEQRVEAHASLASAVASLEASGVARDQVAALLDVAPDELARLLNAARRSQPPTSGR
jgi:hypothetical protein